MGRVFDIEAKLKERLPEVLRYLLPNGVMRGRKFYVGNIRGDAGDSLVIELIGEKKGLWHDFAMDTGGNIFKLWAEVKNLSISEAIKDIEAWLGIRASPRPAINKWTYTDERGELICTIQRVDTNQGKYFIPRLKDGSKGMPEVRPLYNLPSIIHSSSVIIAEGEKSADALIKTGYNATTAMGGANTPLDKTDFTPLSGKDITLWPDNDAIGKRYAEKLYHHLKDKAKSIRIIDIPKDTPSKWDAADCSDIKSFLETCSYVEPVASNQLRAINPVAWKGEPPAREWIIQDWVPRGYVSALYGDGGVGKSLLAQQIMTAISVGAKFISKQPAPQRTIGIFCEDDENELWRRQNAINRAFNIDMSDLSAMGLISRLGKNNSLMSFDSERGVGTQFFDDLFSLIKEQKPALVVLDTAADLFEGNENSRTQVRQFIQGALGKIAREANCGVLLCAHPSAAGLSNGSGNGGSTAWHNTVRSRLYLSNEDGIRTLSRKKANYCSVGAEIKLKWDKGAFRLIDETAGDRLTSDEQSIINLIISETEEGRVYSERKFSDYFENKEGLKSARTIRRQISQLVEREILIVKKVDNLFNSQGILSVNQ